MTRLTKLPARLAAMIDEQEPRGQVAGPVPSVSKPREPTDLEREFDTLWLMLKGPALVPEYEFAKPDRLWRFDRAHLATKVAVEIEGGIWTDGAHTRGEHFNSDAEKYNAASAAGWRVFRLTINMLHDDPVRHLGQIIVAIKRAIA